MAGISHGDATCILFGEKLTEEAAERCMAILDAMPLFDICHTEDYMKPMLQTKLKVNGDPAYYHRYAEIQPEPLALEETEIPSLLENYSQVIQYLNCTYLSTTPSDKKLFERKLISAKEIYSEAILRTDLFDGKGAKSFSTWCGMQKVDFVKARQQRRSKEQVGFDLLHVGQSRKNAIQGLKRNGYEITGYVRKSPGKESEATRLQLLGSMVDRLYRDSSVDKMFASYSSAAKVPFASRDIKQSVEVPNTSGSTKDLMSYLPTASKPVAIVTINFAGLTTNTSDLKQWLVDSPVIKVVVIDNIEGLNQSQTYTREQLLTDESILQRFDSRPAPVRRSSRS